MPTTCFVSYEIHPTTWGGCGVLLRHAAAELLRRGHDVVFLLDVPPEYFARFDTQDRLELPHAERCRAYAVEAECRDLILPAGLCRSVAQAVRFAHAWHAVAQREHPDYVEFFEYCGVGYYAFLQRLFGVDTSPAVLGTRLHNAIELIDRIGGTRYLDDDRYRLYALERAALRLAEVVLTPSRTYFDHYYRDTYAIDPARAVVSQPPKEVLAPVHTSDPAGSTRRITFVGRMYAFKGVDRLVEAAVALLSERPGADLIFELIGPDTNDTLHGDSFVGMLGRLIPANLRGHFEFPGYLDHDAIRERLRTSSFAVFPNRFESFCYALHEVYDAGVPVVAADLPGFAEFFRHEENALLYDGSTEGLVRAMARLLDDSALRERLSRPVAVADRPLGAFYDEPAATQPLAPESYARPPSTLVLVLEDHGEAEAGRRTRQALSRAGVEDECVVSLRKDGQGAGGVLRLLGHLWAHGTSGSSGIAPHTREALVVLRAGDVPDASWWLGCRRALAHPLAGAFAGTWGRRAGAVEARLLDLCPERYPFEHGADPTRVLMRTEPGVPIDRLFDDDLGPLGEVGYLWQAVRRWGPGVVLARPMMDLGGEAEVADENSVKFLVLRYGDLFAARLALWAGLLDEQVRTLRSLAPEGADGAGLSVDQRRVIASSLDGRTLSSLAWQRLRQRLREDPASWLRRTLTSLTGR